jgi:hypothetical protein
MPFANDNDEEDDLFDSVSQMADRMGLKGDKRAVYIHDHMTQGGYQQVQTRDSYTKIQQQESDDGDSGNRWGFGRGGGGGSSRRSARNSRDDDDSF